MIYSNAQSLMAHQEEIQQQIIQKRYPALLALSETRLTSDIEDNEVNIPGYSIVRCDSENTEIQGGRRVMIYIKDDIKYEVILREKIKYNCWCIGIEMRGNGYKGAVAVVYHSPSASDGDFIRFMSDMMDVLVVKGQYIVIEDFNIDLMKDSFYKKKLIAEMTYVQV